MINTKIRDVFKVLTSLAYPPACSSCSKVLAWQTTVAMCTDCVAKLPMNPAPHCEDCGHSLYHHPEPCPDRFGRHYLNRIYFMLLYEKKAKHFVQQFKIQRADHLIVLMRLLIRRYLRTGTINPTATYDCLVPIPARRTWGGRSQPSHLLAALLSQELQLPVQSVLTRHAATKKQSSLNRRARLENSLHAYRLKQPLRSFKSVLLVDDIITTGFTARACAQLLAAGGARHIDVFACARGQL